MAEPTIETFRAGDGYEWKYRRFDAQGPARGSIVVLHGIQSHGGWYLESARWLAEQGWNVSLLDRRGCGLNDLDRGDAPSFRRLLDDVAEYLKTIPPPRVIVGISWGGKLAVALQKRHRGLCDGLVLIAPGIRPLVRPRLWRRLAIAMTRFVAPRTRFAIPLNEPELFTANSKRQQFIRDDALALRDATARLLFESARMDVYLRVCRKRVTIPGLVLLAERDRIIHNRRTRKYVARFRGLTDIIEYRGAHHTLEFEERLPFLENLGAWLERTIGCTNAFRG